MKYILRPSYGDMSVVVLGSKLETVISNLKKHWDDELKNPDDYYEDQIVNINLILNKNYNNVMELVEDYNKLMNEDYCMETSS